MDFDLTAMEPVSWPEPFDAPEWMAQVKWDGVRMLAVIGNHSVLLTNRKGHDRTVEYPELQVLHELLPEDSVLDGEVVVFSGGKPSFSSVIQRDFSRNPSVVRAKMSELPITFFVFDLLYLRGQDLRRLPWSKRQDQLRAIWPGNQPGLHLVESFSSGQGLFAAVKQQGLEGIVLKRTDSAYVPGKRSGAWRKVKFFREVNCLVGGYSERQGRPSSLLLGLLRDDQLVYVGSAGSGLSTADWQALMTFFQAAECTRSPFSVRPAMRDRTLHFVQPKLAVRIKFMEWSSDLKLRAPVIVALQNAETVDCSFLGQGV
jgi:bifunctional non-homologous end joining protein LigD